MSNSTLHKLLKTKNSAIADVICWLIENANDDGVVEHCTITEAVVYSGKSQKIVQFAFEYLEAHGYAKRCTLEKHKRKTYMQLEDDFLGKFINQASSSELIETYLQLSDEIDNTTQQVTDYFRRLKAKKTQK